MRDDRNDGRATGGGPARRRPRRLLGLLVTASLLGGVLAAVAAPSKPASASVVYNGAGATWHIGVIGDSAWAGIRWLNAFAPLQRFNFRADLESCRRTTMASCRGREGYAPPTTLNAMKNQAGNWGAVLVVATGYNDPGTTFAASVDAVMAEAMSQQIYRVVWMTMRTADVTYVSPGFISNSYTFRDNNRILLQKAAQYGGRLQIADWATYSAGHAEWFTSDGIHLRPGGALAAADYIADSAARALSGVSLTPAAPAPSTPADWVNVNPGDRGERVAIVQQYLMRAGIAIFGGADGIYGSYTTDAVREFQNRVGLPASGLVDKATAVELGLWYRDGSTPRPSSPQWVNVSPGDSGMRVAIVHHYLRRAGVAVNGDADGVYRKVTTDAVKAYQTRVGLPVTGVVDRATAIRLGLWPSTTQTSAAPTSGWVNVSPGDTGMRVAIVHSYLRKAGIAVNGDYDGRYGDVTAAAVRAFQTGRRLPVTGVVDEATAIALGLWYRSGALVSATLTTTATALTTTTTAAPATTTTTTATTAPAPTTAEATTPADVSAPALDDPSTWVDLTVGSHGPLVADVQRALMNAGIYLRGGASGEFGPETGAAVVEYQELNGLPATGVVDAATAQALGVLTGPDGTIPVGPDTTEEPPPVPASTEPSDGGEGEGSTAPPSTPNVDDPIDDPIDTTTDTVTDTTTDTSAETAPEPTDADPAPAVSDAPEEAATATIGDLVWLDGDSDGRQDVGEPGVGGAVVRLLDSGETVLAETTTDGTGRYEFVGVGSGTYLVEFVVPDGHDLTAVDVGDDDALDSDAEPDDVVATDLEVTVRVVVAIDDATGSADLDVGFVVASTDPAPTVEPAPTLTDAVATPTTDTTAPIVTEAPSTTAAATTAPTTAAPETSATTSPAPSTGDTTAPSG